MPPKIKERRYERFQRESSMRTPIENALKLCTQTAVMR